MIGSRKITTNPHRTSAFTLIELLVAISISAILVGLLIPACLFVRSSARNASCKNQMRQIATAIQHFESSKRRLPPGTIGFAKALDFEELRVNPQPPYWTQIQQTSFLVLILPFVEQTDRYRLVDRAMTDTETMLADYLDDAGNRQFAWYGVVPGFSRLASTTIPLYSCPSDNLASLGNEIDYMGGSNPCIENNDPETDAVDYLDFLNTHLPGNFVGASYLGCAGAMSGGMHPDPERHRFRGAMSSGERIRSSSIPDGSSQTLLVGETLGWINADGERRWAQSWVVGGLARGRGDVPWKKEKPWDTGLEYGINEVMLGNLDYSPRAGFGSAHRASVNFCRCDGSVHSINREVDWKVFYQLSGAFDGG